MPKAKTPKKAKSLTREEFVEFVESNSNHNSVLPGNLYNLSITVGGETLKGKGATALEALQSITKPTKIVTKGEIILTKGDKKAQMTWQPAKLKKLFYPLNQFTLAKQLDYLMK